MSHAPANWGNMNKANLGVYDNDVVLAVEAGQLLRHYRHQSNILLETIRYKIVFDDNDDARDEWHDIKNAHLRRLFSIVSGGIVKFFLW